MGIFEAIKNGDIEYLEEFIHDGGNINCKDSTQFTPLMVAAENKNIKIAAILIFHLKNQNIAFNAFNSFGLSPLIIAAQKKDFEMIKLLVNHGAIDLPNCYNKTAVTEARKLDYIEINVFLELHTIIINKIACSIIKLMEKQPINEDEEYNLRHFYYGLDINLLDTKIDFPLSKWHPFMINYLKEKDVTEQETSSIIEQYQMYYHIDTISIEDDSQSEDELYYSDSDVNSNISGSTEDLLRYEQWLEE